jgi:uncharacterized membrane protein
VVLAGAAGDVSVTRAMKSVGEVVSFRPRALLGVAWRAARNLYLWMGIFWKAVAFFTLLALLTRAELSWVVPATAVSFVVETVAAKYLLKEHISGARWAGVLCICAGISLISL